VTESATTAVDVGLVRAARDGDATSLGLLLERYRPSLLAHALRLLDGSTFRAQDAVQETFVVALCKLTTVRDPAAVGGWLHAVLRNACLLQRRRHARERTSEDPGAIADRTVWTSFEEELDQLALRSWIWAGIEELTEPLQLPLVLRYFTGAADYEQIAAICGVPVGTVRSRLNEAKRKLAEALLREAASVESTDRRAGEAAAEEFEEAIDRLTSDHDPTGLADGCAPDVAIRLGPGRRLSGRDHIVRGAEADAAAGVSYRLTNVLASNRVLVAEGDFLNPRDDPHHCPPGAVQVHYRPDGWTRQIVVHYIRRS
jgi:RNA polymerase sigma-70 factor (ECF subfamily)